MSRQAGSLALHPSLELGNQRRAAFTPHGEADVGRLAVDLALDGEDGVDALDRL
jgi:hypothetical protein